MVTAQCGKAEMAAPMTVTLAAMGFVEETLAPVMVKEVTGAAVTRAGAMGRPWASRASLTMSARRRCRRARRAGLSTRRCCRPSSWRR